MGEAAGSGSIQTKLLGRGSPGWIEPIRRKQLLTSGYADSQSFWWEKPAKSESRLPAGSGVYQASLCFAISPEKVALSMTALSGTIA